MQSEWLWGLGGGLLIGLGAAMLLWGNGKIMGASGLLGGLVDGSGRSDWAERAVFLIATFATPLVIYPLFTEVDTHISSNWLVLVVAGLLVGIGTRIANGCTSGHGVCGISRFSLRGIVATLIYIAAGGASILVFRHLLGVI